MERSPRGQDNNFFIFPMLRNQPPLPLTPWVKLMVVFANTGENQKWCWINTCSEKKVPAFRAGRLFLCVLRETRFSRKWRNSIFYHETRFFPQKTQNSSNFEQILHYKIQFDIKICMGWPFLLHFCYQSSWEKGKIHIF